jgi:hypothetical protein
MSGSLDGFFKEHPLWAVLIAALMILPMIGAVLHIVLKALGRKGIDGSPPSHLPPADVPESGENNSGDGDQAQRD